MLPIFKLIADQRRRAGGRALPGFNMGIGMVAIVAADQAEAILKFIRAQKHDAWLHRRSRQREGRDQSATKT